MDRLSELKVPQLKQVLKDLGLSTTGLKVELIARLSAVDSELLLQAIDKTTNEMTIESEDESSVPRQGDIAIASTSASGGEVRRENNDLVQREVELLRRENAVLQRELWLVEHGGNNEPTVTTRAPAASAVRIREIGELLADFTGDKDTFDTWKGQAEILRTTYRLNEDAMKILLSSRLKGKAQEWFHSTPTHLQLSVRDLFEQMDRMFNNRKSKLELRKNFEKRTWQQAESFPTYFHAKTVLANKASIARDELVDYLIDGIPDNRMRDQARIQRFSCEDDLMRAFANISLPSHSKGFQHKKDAKPEKADRRNDDKKEESKDKTTVPREKRLRCFNCSEFGHVSSECTKPAREKGSCFRCGSKTHRIKECREETEKNPPSPGETAHVVQANGNIEPFMINVKYAIADNYNNVCNFSINAMIDTGSPISLIREDYVPISARKPIPSDLTSYYGINKTKINILGICKLDCTINDAPVELTFYVVSMETITFAAILGRDYILPHSRDVSSLIADEKEKNEIIPANESEQVKEFNDISAIDCAPEATTAIEKLNINSRLEYPVGEEIKQLIVNEYLENQARSEPPLPSDTELVISLKHNQPISYRPRRLSYSDKQKLQEILSNLLRDNIIRPSDSPYASPIVLVHKKNGELRLCVDYRELNKITIQDNYPTPLIDDHLDRLRDKQYFTCLDLRNGFYHVKVAESSVKLTAFVTPLGQFEYLRMPFGLTNAPRVFQRFIYNIFSDLIQQDKLLLYIDDILIATKDIDEHIEILREVLNRAAQFHLDFRFDKCSILLQEINYLGYIINKDGIQPGTENIDAILNYPLPRNTREVHRFIGIASFFRRFIKNFSRIAKPLYDLLKKDAKFQFEEKEYIAFETLKNCLASRPILAIYSPKLETELHCDASSSGFGAILMQRQIDNALKPVFYFSKRTTNTEASYHSFELECLAVIYAIKRFHIYLAGIRFKIFTDCDSFRLTLSKQNVNPRVSRWALFLQSYDYSIEYRPGAKMSHVDALSRCYAILVLEGNTFERILSIKQDQDLTIQRIREQLEITESKFFELRDGLVYRKAKDGKLLFYVPECLENNVIRTCHDDIGHVGTGKVVENILRVYWFPKLSEKVKKYITDCLKCIEFSPDSGKSEGYLHPIPKDNLPFHTIHIDHLGPLEKTGQNFKHIFLIVDGFSKFIRLYPCKSTTSEEVLKHLDDYFRAYSRPKRIVSDRGSCFTSSKFTTTLKEADIQHVLIAVGTPRANGQAERINRLIVPMIAKATTDVNKWNRVLHSVEYAVNNTMCRSTNTTPSMLLFGVSQNGENNDKLREILQANRVERDLPSIRQQASDAIEMLQKENTQAYNKRRKVPSTYKEGDYVMIRNIDTTPGINKKFIPKYKGPYVIKKALDFDRYIVTDVEGFQLSQIPYTGTVSVDQLRSFGNKSSC